MNSVLSLNDDKDIVYSSFILKKNGIEAIGNPTFEQWEECGQFIRKAEGSVHFWLGDWLNYGEKKWGEMYSQAMGDTGYAYETLKRDKWLSNEIPLVLRSTNLEHSAARELAPLPQEEKEYWAEKIKKEAIPVRELKKKIKERRKALLPKPQILEGKFSTIVIDPPWPMEFMELETRPNQTQMPYPIMTIDEITNLSIASIADTNCNLFLWTTHKFLPDSFGILKAWGFDYHVCLTWDKTNGRSLFGFNRRTEFCLYAHKGNITVNQRGHFINTIFTEKLREHSRKPDIFYEILRDNTPEPRVDLFSREKREGFAQWGNEIEKF